MQPNLIKFCEKRTRKIGYRKLAKKSNTKKSTRNEYQSTYSLSPEKLSAHRIWTMWAQAALQRWHENQTRNAWHEREEKKECRKGVRRHKFIVANYIFLAIWDSIGDFISASFRNTHTHPYQYRPTFNRCVLPSYRGDAQFIVIRL